MEIISGTKPKARKQYKCDWCGINIEKGEKHESNVLKSEGDIYNWRNHIRCADIARKLEMFDYCDCEGLSKESFMDSISDEYYSITNIDDYGDLPDFKTQLDTVCNKYLSS